MRVDPRTLLGTRFRLHGRDPRTGLDCVGLVAVVHGLEAQAPDDYPLRSAASPHWEAILDTLFDRAMDAQWRAGDVLLFGTGPAAIHLGVWSGSTLIHADTRLRRVVETPPPFQWDVLGVWRGTVIP